MSIAVVVSPRRIIHAFYQAHDDIVDSDDKLNSQRDRPVTYRRYESSNSCFHRQGISGPVRAKPHEGLSRAMIHSSAILGILEKLMRIFEDPYWWTVALSSVVQLTMFGRWIYRRIRNDEMMRAFVEDMAKIHLPHTYALLERICDRQGIDKPDRPQINWIDLQHPGRCKEMFDLTRRVGVAAKVGRQMKTIIRKFGLMLLVAILLALATPGASAQGSQRVNVVQGDTGQAIAGANIWVCIGMVQPAYPSPPACAPAAAIYSDPMLINPVTQPLVSDGLAITTILASQEPTPK